MSDLKPGAHDETSAASYLVLAADLTIVGASDELLRVTGKRRDELVGRSLSEALPGAASRLAVAERDPASLPGSWVLLRIDGALDAEGAPIAKVELDALRADQQRLREQLVISERLALAGTLAAGVAHEIQNPLAIASANLEAIETLLDRADPALVKDIVDPLADARDALRRIRGIVRDVRLFSRPEDEASGPADLVRVVESSLRMAQNEVRHRARVVKALKTTPPIDANEARLGQVVLNLVVNAAQAMPDGRAAENEIRVATWTTRQGVMLEISDTGHGIAKEHLHRIFEPFFTTKRKGGGTGLGLAICRRIVTELGGTIEVSSELGKGTTFRLLLPPSKRPSAMQRAIAAAETAPRRARVLLVDDEAPFGIAFKRLLARHHDLEPLTSGAEALARIAAGARYDLIFSDVMMPDLTGIELLAELRKIAPDQADRVVFLTGGAFTQAAQDALASLPNLRLEKPIDVSDVLAVIAGALK